MYSGPMMLDRKLCERIMVHQYARDIIDAFGVEIEIEGVNIKTASKAIRSFWDIHNDGSLRVRGVEDQAIEYVFNRPFNREATKEAIEILFDYLNSPAVRVYESYRTSVHVHVNCAMETFRTIYNYITLCLIFDELMVSQNGVHRIGNNFCLRAKDALGQVESLTHSIERGQEFFGIDRNERYSSINFASLCKFGTIEFRSLEFTTHAGRLTHWIGTVQHMKEFARAYNDSTEVIGDFSRLGAKDFLWKILGPYAVKYAGVVGYESMLLSGMRIAQDFAFCSEWIAEKRVKDDDETRNRIRQKQEAQAAAELAGHLMEQGQPFPPPFRPARPKPVKPQIQ